jgi:hypothetical protein
VLKAAAGWAAVGLMIVVPRTALVAMHLQMGLHRAAATAEAMLKSRPEFQASCCSLTVAAVAVEAVVVTMMPRPVGSASP